MARTFSLDLIDPRWAREGDDSFNQTPNAVKSWHPGLASSRWATNMNPSTTINEQKPVKTSGHPDLNVVGLGGSRWATPEAAAKVVAKPIQEFFHEQDEAEANLNRKINASALCKILPPPAPVASVAVLTPQVAACVVSMPPSREQIFASMRAAHPNQSAAASPVSVARAPAPASPSSIAASTSSLRATKINTPTLKESSSQKLSPLAAEFQLSTQTYQVIAATPITQPAPTNANVIPGRSTSLQPPISPQRENPKTFLPPTQDQLTAAFRAATIPTTQPIAQSFSSAERLTTRPNTTDIVARRMIGQSLGVHIPQKTDVKTLQISAALKKKNDKPSLVDHAAEQKKRMDEFYAMMKGGKK